MSKSTLLFALGAAGLGSAVFVACVGNTVTTTNNDGGTSDASADTVAETSSNDAAKDVVAVDAPPDAGPFDPKTIAGLVLWLDATKGVTGTSAVSAWADQSGKANDALMATANYQPALVASSIGGKPAIHFEAGRHLEVNDADPTLRFGTGDFYVTVVVKYNLPSTAYGILFSKQNAGSPFAGVGLFANFVPSGNTTLSGQMELNTFASTASSMNDNVARQFAFARIGSNLSVRINGAAATAASGGQADAATAINADAVGRKIQIGANANGGQLLTGDIAEIIAVKGVMAPADVTNLEAYLKAKYSL